MEANLSKIWFVSIYGERKRIIHASEDLLSMFFMTTHLMRCNNVPLETNNNDHTR